MMFSRTTLLWLNRLLWTGLVGAVLALGLVVSLGRYYIPYVETEQRELVDAFNRRTGLHLSIGHIAGRWQRLSPYFVIDDLRLYNPKNPEQVVLHIDHAEVQLGIFRSIHARTLAISRLRAQGTQLQLEETAPGHWQLPGFDPADSNRDAAIELLLAIYRASLIDTHIDLQFIGGSKSQLIANTLQLQRAGAFRRLNLALTVAQNTAPFTLVVEAEGDPRAANNFSARGYAALHGVDLTPALPAARAFGVDLQHGRIDGAAWLDWRPGSGLEIRGNVALPQLDIAGFGAPRLAPLTAITTTFLLRVRDEQLQLWLPQLRATWGDVQLDFPRLQINTNRAHPDLYQLALPELQLAPLRAALLAGEALPAHLRDTVAALEPRGTLRNVQLMLPLRTEQRDRLRLRAQLEQIALRPWHDAPGVEGGGGYIDAGLDAGTLDLVSDGFTMEFPHVYREPLRFDRARGRIGWRRDGERVLVNSGPIPVHSDAGDATAQFALDLPLQPGSSRPLMTLMVGLRNSGAQYRDRFIPYTLDPALLAWLGRSVRGGVIPLGGFIYRGSLRAHDLPERSVQLFLDVRAGELAYQPEWPPLHDLRADVWIDDAATLVRAPSARMLDRIALSDINVEIQHPPAGAVISVRGDVRGYGDDVLRVLRQSPLHKQTGSALDAWRWQGALTSRLDLLIPLDGTQSANQSAARPAKLRVDSELGPGTLTLLDKRIVVTDVRGALAYSSENGLQSSGIAAKWYGRPLAISVATEPGGALNLRVGGRIDMNDLKSWLEQPLFGYASGDAAFDSTLRIAGADSALQVRSDLLGVTLNLPAPYTKQADEVLPLDLRINFLGRQRELQADLGDWADLLLRWDEGLQVDAGVLRLGKTGRTQYASEQMLITGRVPTLDFNAWREVLARAASATDRQRGDDSLAPSLRDVHFDKVVIGDLTVDGMALSGHREQEGWWLGVSAQQVAGTLRIPHAAAQPWNAKLNYLRLPAPAAAVPDAAPKPSVFAQIDPARIIPLDLSIEHLWRGSSDLGSVALQLRPIEHGMRAENISGLLRGLSIGEGGEKPAGITWTRRDGVDQTALSARVLVDDAAQALLRWGYEPVLTSRRGEVDLNLQWPGAPDQFQFVRATGDARLRIDDGRFLKASSSASGALKVVGIFNFANFLKRLQLDFSDVFKDGVSFDEMKGSFNTEQGVLRTVDPVEIKSPSSRFRIAGQIDFNTDQTNMELVATLPVASNLPWVAALAGGLPVAAGVFVASKIFENQVDKFASAAYDVSGPWRDPKVKLRRVFSDKLQQKPADTGASRAQEASETREPSKPREKAP